jgi:leader peptidase (prepilin peptidase)/N-methyltransferase
MAFLIAGVAAIVFAVWHSFADALAWRIYQAWYSPVRKTIRHKISFVFAARSRCEFCGATIPWYGLIPVLGFFLLKGKCHHCSRRLSLRFPALELCALIYGALLGTFLVSPGEFLTALFAYALVWIMIYHDYRSLLIPTEAILALFLVALGNLLLVRYPRWFEMQDLALGLDLAVSFVWYFLFHLLRVVSGYKLGLADVRLVLALGFLLGHPFALWLPGLAALLAIVFWLLRRYSVLLYAPSGEQIPFGVFLGTGYLLLNLARAAYQ